MMASAAFCRASLAKRRAGAAARPIRSPPMTWRAGRGMESEAAAADRGATDKAVAGLLFQGCLRRWEAAALRWADVQGYYPLRNCWCAICADANLGSLCLHDLRHTPASQAIMPGENLPLVSKLLGHRRHRTTAGYAHLADAHLVEAAEKIGKKIAKAMVS